MPYRVCVRSVAAIAILVCGGCRQARLPGTGSIPDGSTGSPDDGKNLDASAPPDAVIEREADGRLVGVVDGSLDTRPDITIDEGAVVDAQEDANRADAPQDAIPDQGTPPGCVQPGATVFKSLGLANHARERTALALDRTDIYVGIDNGIWSIPKSGGLPNQIWTGGAETVVQLALDESHVYFSTGGAVRRVMRGGGAVETLAMDLDQVSELAVDQSSVYWAEQSASPAWRGRVAKVAKGGGSLRVLAESVRAVGVAVDGPDLYYLVSDAGPAAHGIFRTSLEGGPATKVYASGIAGRRLLANGTHLFALLYNAVVRVDKQSGAAVTFAGRSVGGNSLALDDGHVYWTVLGYDGGRPDPLEGGRLLKAPQAGGAVTDFANCLTKPTALGIDASHVYWSQGYTGEIWRALK